MLHRNAEMLNSVGVFLTAAGWVEQRSRALELAICFFVCNVTESSDQHVSIWYQEK